MSKQYFENQRVEEWFYCLCLLQIPGIGLVKAKQFVELYATAKLAWENIWKEEAENGSLFSLAHQSEFENRAYEQLQYEQQGEQTFLLHSDKAYPSALWVCHDAPLVLYIKGELPEWNAISLSIVGTRNCTSYGKEILTEFIKDIAPLNPLIVSGAAAGIDGEAHRLCLQYNLPTIAILGHGHNFMFPACNRSLAREIVANRGALVTEFRRKIHPNKTTFLQRNRLVAAWTSATLVVESGLPGGSLSTARIAHDYSRDVFAFPARVSDLSSVGCLDLIFKDKAKMIRKASDLQQHLGWKILSSPSRQTELLIPIHLKTLLQVIEKGKATHWNEWFLASGLSSTDFSSLLLELELLDYIKVLPGSWYMRKI